jgi:type II secretory pathway pseudopilin PulG
MARSAHRSAFTLIEAVVAIGITVVAGSAVLLGIASSVTSADDALARTQAAGMAQQLMDEIAGQLYCEDPAQPYQWPFARNAYEIAGQGRERYNDIDDYEPISTQPPTGRYGVLLGTEDGVGNLRDPNFRIASGTFSAWQQSARVYYVSTTNPSQILAAGSTSAYRMVEVKINVIHPTQGTRTLATLRRVFTYVPIQ